MKFIVSSTLLLSHLQTISRVINSKNSMAILDNFLFRLEGTRLSMSQKTLYKEFFSFSAIVYDILNHKYGIGFTTFSHAGNPVPVFAIGEGCEVFSRLNNNVEIPLKMKKLIDLD